MPRIRVWGFYRETGPRILRDIVSVSHAGPQKSLMATMTNLKSLESNSLIWYLMVSRVKDDWAWNRYRYKVYVSLYHEDPFQ